MIFSQNLLEMFSYHVCKHVPGYIFLVISIIDNFQVYELPFSMCDHELLREGSQVRVTDTSSYFHSFRCVDIFVYSVS